MVIWGIVGWWYGDGWHQCWLNSKERLASMLDFFSIGLLLRTLFAPFRQISAGNVRGPLPVQLRAFVDRLFSRLVGCAVRLFMVGIGLVAITLTIIVNGVVLLLWAVVPLLPIAGLVLFLIGWMPWSQ